MTTQRQNRVTNEPPPLRGAYMHLHTHPATEDQTTLLNATLRGQFHYPDGRPVRIKAGPRAALTALLSYGQEGAADPTWRLDMDHFTASFAESITTVYGWIRTLEETGFVVRRRVNNPDTGQFEWHLDVAARPGVLTGAARNPRSRPSTKKGGDGAAPPVDNSETAGRAHPPDSPGWQKPSTVNRDTATSYREITTKRLPASPPVPAHARDTVEEEAGDSARDEDTPALTLVRPPVAAAFDDTALAAEPDWTAWVTGLLDHPAVIAAHPLRPGRRHIDAIRREHGLRRGTRWQQRMGGGSG
jgi:hypothetical protein